MFAQFRNHTLLDFILGNAAIAFPFLLGIDRALAETWIPVIGGIGLLINNFFTDHDLGIFKRLSVSQHLYVDLGIGLAIMLSPWMAGFFSYTYLPHLFFGGLITAFAGFEILRSPTRVSNG